MNKLKVLMLGWELPPFFAGGVGMVCYHLTKSLCQQGVEVTYVMPFGPRMIRSDYMKILVADNLFSQMRFKLEEVHTLIAAYQTPDSYDLDFKKYLLSVPAEERARALYGPNVFQEAYLFAQKVKLIAAQEDFDVIHAHDHWTFPAGIAAKQATGKPLVVHVHITEFDKSGGMSVNQRVYDMEREGMHAADLVIVVSNFIKQRLMHDYGVPEYKIRVVHNAAEPALDVYHDASRIKENDKIVLFIGRVTLQKGPDYFVEAANKVLKKDNNVRFVMAGSGDMLYRMIRRVGQLGISNRFQFAGFLKGEDVDRLFAISDVYVMPSVSEPFGISPLEAMRSSVPVIISKQSGVSEVLKYAVKVNFWDVDALSDAIYGLLNYNGLSKMFRNHGREEVENLKWDNSAKNVKKIYESATMITIR